MLLSIYNMKSRKKCENISIYSYNLMGDILKKIFETIGLLGLVCFCFFYTNKISMVIKDNDDILKQIKQIKEQYKIEPIDAKIDGNTIIPGLSGSEIDVNNSYKKMKKINSFNDNLLVYKKINPSVSVKNVYDKYIISGNKSKQEVSLLFIVNDNDNINNILSILDEHEVSATFFTDGYWFENNNQLIIDLVEKGHNVGNLGYSYNYNNSSVSWMNAIIKKIANQKETYCYNISEDSTALDICSNNKSYTIRPTLIVKNNPLIEIKKDLTNGSIISLEVNNTTIKELPLILDFIDSKGLKMVNIENLIEE